MKQHLQIAEEDSLQAVVNMYLLHVSIMATSYRSSSASSLSCLATVAFVLVIGVSIIGTNSLEINYMYTAATKELDVSVNIPEDVSITQISINCRPNDTDSSKTTMIMNLTDTTSTINFTLSDLVGGVTYTCCANTRPVLQNLICQVINTTVPSNTG